jgi:hypothetical protein
MTGRSPKREPAIIGIARILRISVGRLQRTIAAFAPPPRKSTDASSTSATPPT